MVKIYTFSDKRPDFIALQNNSFKCWLQDDQHEFIVCNNASSDALNNQIKKACADNDLQCLEVDKDFSDAATACEVPIKSCIDRYIRNSDADISVIIDSDIFLFAPFNFKRYLVGYDVAGIVQQREKKKLFNLLKTNIIYIWNALLILDHRTIKFDEFDVSIIPGLTDVGGGLHRYIKKYKPSVKWMKHTPDIEQEEQQIFVHPLQELYQLSFGMQIIEDAFIHYYKGSNWNNDSAHYHQTKTKFLIDFLSFSNETYPLELSKSEGFNNQWAHARKHYNGIRNNANKGFNLKQL